MVALTRPLRTTRRRTRHSLLVWLLCTLLTVAAASTAMAYDWPGKLTEATSDLKNPDPARRAAAVRGLTYFSLQTALPYLEGALDDDSTIVRLATMEVLVEMGAYSTAPRLQEMLSDSDSMLRLGAIRALGELGTRDDLDAMVRTLGDSSAKVRSATVQALSRMGLDEVRAPIATMLNDQDREVVIMAIEALARIGDRTAVFPLLEKVKDPSLRVQIAAIGAIGRLGDQRATTPLLALLYSPHKEVQLAVIDALGRLGDGRANGPLVKLMWTHHRTPTGSRIIYALGDIGDPSAASPLLQMMRFGNTRQAAADALKKMGSPVVPSVLDALAQSHEADFQRLCLSVLQYIQTQGDADVVIRGTIANALIPALGTERYPESELLGALLIGRTPQALGPLYNRLGQLMGNGEEGDFGGGERTKMRRQILTGLVGFEDQRVVTPLLKLYEDLDKEEQRLALDVFGAAGSPLAIDVLGKALRDGDLDAQMAAAKALGQIDHPRAGRLLLENMQAERKHLLPEISLGLGANTSGQITQALLEVAQTADGEVRFAALQALGEHVRRTEGQKLGRALLELATDASDERLISRALDAMGPRPVNGGSDTLIKLYKNKTGVMLRVKILQMLGDWGATGKVAFLKGVVTGAEHPRLKAEAAWALGQLGDKSATEVLLPLLEDKRWPVSLNAAAALVRLADPAAADALKANLPDAPTHTRINILLALGAIGQAPERQDLLAMAHREAEPRMIEAIARILAAGGEDADMRTLKTLRERASDMATRALIDRLLAKGQAPKGNGWVRYILNDAGRRMIGQRAIVVLPDGVLVGRASDSAGEIRVENTGEGRCRVIFLDDTFTLPR